VNRIEVEANERAAVHDLNSKKDILATFACQENVGELTTKLKNAYRNDKPRMREVELLYHTFYEGGTATCRATYYRHINRALIKDK
jgi:hypothetical protein